MAQIRTRYRLGDIVYCLDHNIDYASAIPAIRKFTIRTILISRDGIAYTTEYNEEPIPEEELFSSVDEAIEFVSDAMQQSAENLDEEEE